MSIGDNETIQALKTALRVAKCPNSCRNGAVYIDQGGGDFDMEQCPFCANRTELIGESE